jgi:hypothetical protein
MVAFLGTSPYLPRPETWGFSRFRIGAWRSPVARLNGVAFE